MVIFFDFQALNDICDKYVTFQKTTKQYFFQNCFLPQANFTHISSYFAIEHFLFPIYNKAVHIGLKLNKNLCQVVIRKHFFKNSLAKSRTVIVAF